MKKKTIIMVVLLILGISIIAFPFVSDMIYSYESAVEIEKYKEKINAISEAEKNAELEAAQKYNEKILSGKTNIEVANNASSTINLLGIGENIGYVSVPSIDVYQPIYNGTTENVLQYGVGLLENTCLPVGGKGTHAVLAGHTGLATKKIFDNISKLKYGDVFYVYVLDEVLAYRVDNIKTVLPDEVNSIVKDETKDYVTLLTCTPYMINSHRLLVRGVRTDISEIERNQIYDEITTKTEEMKEHYEGNIITSSTLVIILIVILIINLIILIVLLVRLKERHRKIMNNEYVKPDKRFENKGKKVSINK